MIPPKKNIKGKFNFVEFNSVHAFNEFVDLESLNFSEHNREVWSWINKSSMREISSESDWFGTPTPKSLNELHEHTEFLGMEKTREILPLIRRHLDKYLSHLDNNVMPKPKVSYNDHGIGMFSFDRAAMGLYQLGKIDTSTPISSVKSQLNVELGRNKIQTSVKSVYSWFENKLTSYPSMRLYLLAGANANIKGDELLYVGLACAELVEFLEARGVAVELNVLLGSEYDNQVFMAKTTVKRFEDRLDKNQILLLSSDPRYFRYRGFKAIIALGNYFHQYVPESLGGMTKAMGKEFVKAFDENGFVFEQSYSMDAAACEICQIIEEYKAKLRYGK